MKIKLQLQKITTRLAAIVVLLCFACEDFVKIDPPKTDLISQTVFADDQTATAALADIYYRMMDHGFADGDFNSFTFLGSLLADEQLDYYVSDPQSTTEVRQFADNALLPNSAFVLNLWGDNYKFIYKANAVLEGITASATMTTATKKQLEGEAKFMRAFCHFYLVNLWGDVPLVLTTDYQLNTNIARTSKEEVYKQIVTDLTDAQNLLPQDFSVSQNERVRVNSYAASALLARVYLYTGDFVKAETAASRVIGNTDLFSLVTDLTTAFDINNTEAIWQQWTDARPKERRVFRFLENPTFSALRPEFAESFEDGDLRKDSWIHVSTTGAYSSYKYYRPDVFPAAQYSVILRLAEQYLIRAEARAQLNELDGAAEDINVIRIRAGLAQTTANDQPSLLAAVAKERKSELFNEWGHRWLDLKRTNQLSTILSSMKPEFKTTSALFPIPDAEQKSNTALTNAQNPGY